MINTAKAEDDIHELMDSWQKAVQAKDIDGIVSHYARDILAFDAISQLQFKGVDAYRNHWEACVSMCPAGEMVFEIDDLKIAAADDTAFSHCLNWCGVKDENGKDNACWMRDYLLPQAKWKMEGCARTLFRAVRGGKRQGSVRSRTIAFAGANENITNGELSYFFTQGSALCN
ncbi:Ketosteroid isomerase homolog [Nitrosospira briensis]|uniref:Ketosteroid isomerase homolog n=1 Tax=Nitrosospira briensis TaxID=35799 RepID=A0A1I4YDH5_9PROT|nr:nuclear transport factor 2 family protein [Nitrosospira briensis]SFN35639.1 Ketosteroid isomerase homolog [Nitrosospira briensis]